MAWLKWRGTPERGRWHAIWWERAGKTRKKRSRALSRNRAHAEKLLDEIQANLARRGVGLGQLVAFAQLRQAYLQQLVADGCAPGYVARVRIALAHFERHYPKLRVADVTADLLDAYKVKRRADGIEGSTMNRELGAIKAAVRKGRRWQFQVNDLSDVGKVKNAEKAKSGYTESDIQELLRKALPRLLVVLYLGLYAGLRRGEMLRLRVRDVNFELDRIILGDGWKTKTGAVRALPLHPRLKTFLKAWLKGKKPDELVLPWECSEQHLTGQFSSLRRKCGIERGSIHRLRHTFVTALKRVDVDTKKVQLMVGHKKEETTGTYTHLEIKDLKSSMRKLKYG